MVPDQPSFPVIGRLRKAYRRIPRKTISTVWHRYYWLAVGILVGSGVLSMGRPFFRRHGFGPPLPHNDSVILEYVGWFIANGHTLYTDIWEIKPPLAFFPPYLFAQFTGTNMYAHHLLGIATTTVALALTAAFTARVVGTLTQSSIAGVAAGMMFFALPDLFYLPWLGYKAKIMVYVFGMAGVDHVLRERYFSSGVLAGLAVGFWQLAIVFPLLTTLYTARSRSADHLKRHVLGGSVAILCIVGSLLLYADIGGFIAEVILGPLVLQSERSAFDPRAYLLFFHNDVGLWATIVGIGGLGLAVLDTERFAAWPLGLGGILVAGIIVFIDFDGLWDMVYPLVFTALGVGIVISYLPRDVGIATVAIVALLLVPTFTASGFIRQEPVDTKPSDGLPPALDAEREHVYWTHQPIRSCRFFGAGTQRSILKWYPDADELAEAPCGDVGLYWNVTKRRVVSDLPRLSGGSRSDRSQATPTPTPEPMMTVSGFDYRVKNDSIVVTVPVVNSADAQRLATVVVEVSAGGGTFTQCKQTTLSPDGRTTLQYQFEVESAESLAINIWINDEQKTSTYC